MIIRNKFSDSKLMDIKETGLPEVREIIYKSVRSFHDLQDVPSFRIEDHLLEISEEMERDAPSLAEILSQETGKPIRLSQEEVATSVRVFSAAADEVRSMVGYTRNLDCDPSGLNRIAYSARSATGPFLYISSYFSPLLSASLRTAAAMAARNSVILKPSSLTPISLNRLAHIISRSGFPANSVQVIYSTGFGNVTKFVVGSKGVKTIGFSGNWETATKIALTSGIKKHIMEIYGNTSSIVWNDADLDTAAEHIARSAFITSTYTGHHLQRVLIHSDTYEYLKNRIIEISSHYRTGDPLDPDTDVGSMISVSEAESAMNFINLSRELGGSVLTGGEVNGTLMPPTIIEGIDTSSYLWNNDIPGPVLLIAPVSSMAEAVKIVNDSNTGLSTALFTSDLNLALFAKDRLLTPVLIVNDFPDYLPFTLAASGSGRNWTYRNGLSYLMEEISGIRQLIIKR